MEAWETSAKEARTYADAAPLRRLNEIKREIMNDIEGMSEDGEYCIAILMSDYPPINLENWTNIYNWLLKLGYQVEDKSLNGHFIVRW